MKATGIVRRIDDLGRVVIPKEIRRTMRIREGDPLEIFTDSDGEVVFKKYSPVGELTPFATQYADVMSRACSLPVLICDRDHVVAAAGVSKRDYQEFRRKIGCAAAGMRAFPCRGNLGHCGGGYRLVPFPGGRPFHRFPGSGAQQRFHLFSKRVRFRHNGAPSLS